MDICALRADSNQVVIFVAYSDSVVREFLYELSTKTFQYINQYKSSEQCVLKVKALKVGGIYKLTGLTSR
jgi:hypothetical protein